MPERNQAGNTIIRKSNKNFNTINYMHPNNQTIAKVFSQYLPCEGIWRNNHCKILSIDFEKNNCLIVGTSPVTGLRYWQDVQDIHLLLTPLSCITDEHAIEVAKIILDAPFEKHKKGWKVTRDFTVTGWPYIRVHNPKNVYSLNIDCRLCNFTLYDMEDDCTAQHDMRPAQVIDYLRGLGYNLSMHILNGKTPIECGIAIDKTKMEL